MGRWIKMLVSIAGTDFSLSRDEKTNRFTDDEADRMVAADMAEEMDQPSPSKQDQETKKQEEQTDKEPLADDEADSGESDQEMTGADTAADTQADEDSSSEDTAAEEPVKTAKTRKPRTSK